MSYSTRSISTVSLSLNATLSVGSQAAGLSAAIQRIAVAASRKSQAGVIAHSRRRTQAMGTLSGASTLARHASSGPLAGLSIAGAARDFASPRAASTTEAEIFHSRSLSFSVCAAENAGDDKSSAHRNQPRTLMGAD